MHLKQMLPGHAIEVGRPLGGWGATALEVPNRSQEPGQARAACFLADLEQIAIIFELLLSYSLQLRLDLHNLTLQVMGGVTVGSIYGTAFVHEIVDATKLVG